MEQLGMRESRRHCEPWQGDCQFVSNDGLWTFLEAPLSDENLRANVELYRGEASDEVSTSCISDVEYLFSQEYITDNNIDLSGIKNAYIISFHLTN
jgi:hypothetical protein